VVQSTRAGAVIFIDMSIGSLATVHHKRGSAPGSLLVVVTGHHRQVAGPNAVLIVTSMAQLIIASARCKLSQALRLFVSWTVECFHELGQMRLQERFIG